MRAIALASAVVIALAMMVTPTQAADRTIQTRDDDRDLAALDSWILDLERAWVLLATRGGSVLVVWTPVPVTSDSQPVDRENPKPTSNDRKARVILEDGAPF
ncbi:MAG: hypothetical protein GTN89_00035 [Acidobacteria bacterium]|nr:hypothetical protein [Acidobacteriota bacterium]NIM60110.1 hypothetical protein [Acidobacteriota bacterium]NIO57779.1 hypothetical protein [Acidobacteriota bacterium]NIQ28788.1 hypothetical protein [Acidobacteriota bacterium]NIQ83246.1 hypothetical protein [Acidobacteriota bacterium]